MGSKSRGYFKLISCLIITRIAFNNYFTINNFLITVFFFFLSTLYYCCCCCWIFLINFLVIFFNFSYYTSFIGREVFCDYLKKEVHPCFINPNNPSSVTTSVIIRSVQRTYQNWSDATQPIGLSWFLRVSGLGWVMIFFFFFTMGRVGCGSWDLQIRLTWLDPPIKKNII